MSKWMFNYISWILILNYLKTENIIWILIFFNWNIFKQFDFWGLKLKFKISLMKVPFQLRCFGTQCVYVWRLGFIVNIFYGLVMDNFTTEIDSVLGAGVTNRLLETIHNLCKATLAKITILSNICILYHKYLFILKFMSPISPVFNTQQTDHRLCRTLDNLAIRMSSYKQVRLLPSWYALGCKGQHMFEIFISM